MNKLDLTLLEKTAFVEGRDRWFTHGFSSLGIRPLCLTDGPHGVRKALAGSQTQGLSGAERSTAFPTAAGLACSWDPLLAITEGKTIGLEALFHDVQIVLGPGACLKRNPLCGRNFEYFSEDPLLSGKMASGWIRGVESQGVGTSLKHYVCNNAENFRFVSNSLVEERSLHELYLKNFEIAVKEGKPATIMCSYNAVNGVWLSENSDLIEKTLRHDWKFEGVVMTDWGATHDRVKGLRAGIDLDMPGNVVDNRRTLYEEYQKNPDFHTYLDASVQRLAALAHRFDTFPKGTSIDWEEHSNISLQVALDSSVLLKNEAVLPLTLKRRYLVLGEFFEKMRYQGAGSSLLSPYQVVSPAQAFKNHGVSFAYEPGFSSASSKEHERRVKCAVEKAEEYDTILLFVGLDEITEMEGFDRATMELPKGQLELIQTLLPLHKKLILVFFGGSPVEVPFIDSVDAFLVMYLPGQMGGEACYQLLFGESCPNGKLAETWPKKYPDVPFSGEYSKGSEEAYQEGIFVGYRYYLSHPECVRFPFGFGLSYTHFSYANVSFTNDESTIQVTFTVTNTGNCFGKEISQIYVSKKESSTYRPVRELKGFAKTPLHPGESQTVYVIIPIEDLRYYETSLHRWVLEKGTYHFEVGSSSQDSHLSFDLFLEGETVVAPLSAPSYCTVDFSKYQPGEFVTLFQGKLPHLVVPPGCSEETLFADYHGILGTIIKKALVMGSNKALRKARRMPPGEEKENIIKDAIFIRRLMMNSCARSLKMSSSGALSDHGAKGFVAFGQGRFFKGLGYFLKKEKKLPDTGK